MVSVNTGNRTLALALYQSSAFQKQQPLLIGTIPDTWMVGGIALVIIALVLLVVAVRCAIHYIPRLLGYETTNRIEGPGHSLGMYSLDLQIAPESELFTVKIDI
ncbi:hypothetical protein OESDEN_00038 [Oesophagostomum dentatum]|uniref:Uncharacterized protein n=1 Tax=Oesophagostomum dentatum TaxID=61180 RepID=A0A0B1TWV8_OESDE|nr:hypothetical protein OESDEN_00038 [Oesophagostomum dentatum]